MAELDEAIDALAVSYESQVRTLFMIVVETLRSTVPEEELTDLLLTRNWPEIINRLSAAVNVGYIDLVGSASTLLGSMAQSGGNTLLRLASVPLSFDLTNPRVEAWIAARAGELITGVSQDAIHSIRQVILHGYTEGIGARAAARMIRPHIGLIPAHSAAVGRFIAELQAQGHPDRVIAYNANTYARRLLAHRAEAIARTETLRATIAGQVEAWNQMIEEGLLPHGVWMRWITTPDDRLCEFCAPMDGKRVRSGEMYVSSHRGFPDGKPEARGPGSARVGRPLKPNPRAQRRDAYGRFTKRGESFDGILAPRREVEVVPHPPLHVRCRCAVVLDFTQS